MAGGTDETRVLRLHEQDVVHLRNALLFWQHVSTHSKVSPVEHPAVKDNWGAYGPLTDEQIELLLARLDGTGELCSVDKFCKERDLDPSEVKAIASLMCIEPYEGRRYKRVQLELVGRAIEERRKDIERFAYKGPRPLRRDRPGLLRWHRSSKFGRPRVISRRDADHWEGEGEGVQQSEAPDDAEEDQSSS